MTVRIYTLLLMQPRNHALFYSYTRGFFCEQKNFSCRIIIVSSDFNRRRLERGDVLRYSVARWRWRRRHVLLAVLCHTRSLWKLYPITPLPAATANLY